MCTAFLLCRSAFHVAPLGCVLNAPGCSLCNTVTSASKLKCTKKMEARVTGSSVTATRCACTHSMQSPKLKALKSKRFTRRQVKPWNPVCHEHCAYVKALIWCYSASAAVGWTAATRSHYAGSTKAKSTKSRWRGVLARWMARQAAVAAATAPPIHTSPEPLCRSRTHTHVHPPSTNTRPQHATSNSHFTTSRSLCWWFKP